MNVKKILRTVVVPVLAGSVAAGVAIVATRPTASVEPGYDVPTDDEVAAEAVNTVAEELPVVPRPRKPKNV
jgi:hypothetical protein